jgi:hypothetical protein
LRNLDSPLDGGLWLVEDGLELLDGEAEDIVIPIGASDAGAAATAVDMLALDREKCGGGGFW